MVSGISRFKLLMFFGGVLALSLYFRAEMVSKTVPAHHPLQADAGQYFAYAYNLRHHHVYSLDSAGLKQTAENIRPDAFRSPGYPLFLSLFITQTPDRSTVALILFAHVLAGTLTVAVAYRLYRDFLGTVWAESAALLTAISPHLVAMSIYLLTETLFCFALVATGWLAANLLSRPAKLPAAALGFTLGVANLIRPSLQLFALLLAGLLVFQIRSRVGRKLAIIFLAFFLLTLSPWHLRNLITLGKWSDDGLQINFLHHGSYPDFMHDGRNESYGFPYRFDPRSNEIAQSTASALWEICQRLRSEPLRYLRWYLVGKPAAFWSWDIVQGQGDIFVYPVSITPYWDNPFFRGTHGIMQALHGLLVILGLIGCVLAWLPQATRYIRPGAAGTARFFSLLLAYYTALHMIGFPEPRYAVPLRPFLYGMSAFAACMTWAQVKTWWATKNTMPKLAG